MSGRLAPRALGVDLGGALNLVGALVAGLSAAYALPVAFALGYGEPVWPFLEAWAIAAAFGAGLWRVTSGAARIGAREGFVVVALFWLLAAAVGALPYVLSGEGQLSGPVDAYFEAMSGFTTTGSSVLTDVAGVDHSLLVWRALTQWLGGLGVLVLALAVLPLLRVGGRELLVSDSPGLAVEPLVSRIRDVGRRFALLYVGLTGLLLAVLSLVGWVGLDGRMSPYEALAHALTTVSTGGFSTHAGSLAAFAATSQWAVVVFMVLAGANFALLYRALARRDPRLLARDEELRVYVALLVLAAAAIAADLAAEDVLGAGSAIRHGVFQAVSIMTTTGFASADVAGWPLLAAGLLVVLMLVGGSAGSPAGAIKVVRHVLVAKLLRRELAQSVHPELVTGIRYSRTLVDERTLQAMLAFILVYLGIFALGTLVLLGDAARSGLDLGLLDAIGAAATTLGNVGPAFGVAGPLGSFAPFSDVSKVVMIVLMWLGRLEIIPVVVLFTRNYWRA